MSGIVGAVGAKSGVITRTESQIGRTCLAYLTSGGTFSGETYHTGYTQYMNDSSGLYSVGTNGITIGISANYLVDLSLLSEEMASSGWRALNLAYNGTTLDGNMYSIQRMDTGGAERLTLKMSSVVPLIAGRAYGIYSRVETGNHDLSGGSHLHTHIGITYISSYIN